MGARVSLVRVKAELIASLRSFYEDVEPAIAVENGYIVSPGETPIVDVYRGATPSRDSETATIGDELGGYVLTVRVRITMADAEASQEILDELADDDGEYSLVQAIYSDPTLAGYATDVDIRSFSGLTVYQDLAGLAKWLGFSYEVLVIAAQS